MIKRKSIKFENKPYSLNWRNNDLIDWVGGGNIYSLSGEFKFNGRGYSYKFDNAIQSDNGEYSVIYETLGTKGLLLKNGEILRELNRSYYQASAYEFPISFVKLENNEYAIIHCPNEYNLIEIENIESGLKLTSEIRKPVDCFHSRLRVNKSNSILINAGWLWHPYGILNIYNINNALKDNSIFDKHSVELPINSEICSAEFLNNNLIFISSTKDEPLNDEELNDIINLNPGQIGLYSINENKFIKKITVNYTLGTLIPIDENLIIDLYEHPKLIDVNTGKIIQKFEDINTGKQDGSIIHHIEKIPPIAVDIFNRRIAIGTDNTIEILTWK